MRSKGYIGICRWNYKLWRKNFYGHTPQKQNIQIKSGLCLPEAALCLRNYLLAQGFRSRRRRDVEDARGVGDWVTAGAEKFQVHGLDFLGMENAVAAHWNAHIRAAERRQHGRCSVRIRQRGVGTQIIQHKPQRLGYR